MKLPVTVVDHLNSEYLGHVRPFCFLMDKDFHLLETWGNPEWCGFSGFRRGQSLADALPYLSGGVSQAAQKLEFVTIQDGVVVHLHVFPGDGGFYVVLLDASRDHDVRQEKQQSVNELRLLQLRQGKMIGRQKELIVELVEAKAELDHLRKEAERGSEAKSRFIAMMSHEFRTPLASIISYSDLAMEKGAGANVVRKSLESISRSGSHLTSLVEAVLDDASINAGKALLNVREFSPREIVEDMSAMMAPLAAEKGLAFAASIESDVPGHVRADDVRLRQILVNTLGNAIKFTEEGSIRLNLGRDGDRLLASVRDTGPGIEEKDQDRVFGAFERGESGAEGGTGLGLTISLRLAKLMGGELSLATKPGHGCTIELAVPFSPAHGIDEVPALPTPSADNLATRAASVLVCDDDVDMLVLLEFYLHRAGYGLIASSTGSEAIEKTIAYQPDLVLMDVNVPGTNGIDAAREMRRQGFDKPIVALTASRLSAQEAARFTLCFRKPAPMQELLSQIKRLTHYA